MFRKWLVTVVAAAFMAVTFYGCEDGTEPKPGPKVSTVKGAKVVSKTEVKPTSKTPAPEPKPEPKPATKAEAKKDVDK